MADVIASRCRGRLWCRSSRGDNFVFSTCNITLLKLDLTPIFFKELVRKHQWVRDQNACISGANFPIYSLKKILKKAIRYLGLLNIALNQILAAVKRYSYPIPEFFMCIQSKVKRHMSLLLKTVSEAASTPNSPPFKSGSDKLGQEVSAASLFRETCFFTVYMTIKAMNLDLCDRAERDTHRLSCGKRQLWLGIRAK